MQKKKDSVEKILKGNEDELTEQIPFFKDIWNDLDKFEEEYTPSNEIQKYHYNLQKSLYNILFSIKYFHEINIDTDFLKLVNKFVKLKLEGNQNDEKDIARLARFHLKHQKENDEDELLVDEEVGVFPSRCPISQMPFETPVTQRFSKNRKACVHTFEKSFIHKLMQNKDTIECPIAACKKKVYKNSLHPDYEYLHYSRYKKFRENITEAKEYFKNLRNEEENKSFDFVE